MSSQCSIRVEVAVEGINKIKRRGKVCALDERKILSSAANVTAKDHQTRACIFCKL